MLQPTTVLIFSGSRNSQLLSVVIESTLPRAFRATILLSAEIPPRLSRKALTNGALGSRAETQRRREGFRHLSPADGTTSSNLRFSAPPRETKHCAYMKNSA